ncbi:MAG: EamA family transporter [Clostridiales bacterium]|nr:EamA family transporter [Clostridiales bacterium]
MKRLPILYAILAALCYGISAPVARLLLEDLSPTFMAALLYLGAGLGMLIVSLLQRKKSEVREAKLTKKELPLVFAMIALDIAAPILLMLGLTMATPATVSLLNNFEIVVTALVALLAFREAVGRRMWIAIGVITLSGLLLSVEDFTSLRVSAGAVFVLLACLCWGIENNCTSRLSLKNPLHIVVIKGLGSGSGALLIALLVGGVSGRFAYIAAALLLGVVAYGLSIYFYILAQRNLGAARTGAYYALAPFIGVGLSFALFREQPTLFFWIALALMLLGAYLAAFERHKHAHAHEALTHEHRHSHNDGHHNHVHDAPAPGEHSHMHVHEALTHNHAHLPDLHHGHSH